VVADWKQDRVGSALRGRNPTVLDRLTAGFAVIGDVQFLPGYCVLLTDDPGLGRLTDLPRPRRLEFLADMELLGEAVERVCARRDPQFRRVNLEILGNTDPFLHAHVWPRYDWEPTKMVRQPVWRYPLENWLAEDTALGTRHDALRASLVAEIRSLRSREPRSLGCRDG
jgi:diadenosine tetraphosphate (Ap4A) HIT family hydrolase